MGKCVYVYAACLFVVSLALQVNGQNSNYGARYYVKSPVSWQETLRLSLESVAKNAPANTIGQAFTSPLILSPSTPANQAGGKPKSYYFDVPVSGWKSIWLVNDFDPARLPSYAASESGEYWYGVWGDAKFIMADGSSVSLSDMDGFCSDMDGASIGCNINAYGKNNRELPTINGVKYQRGLVFLGNSAWHFEFPANFAPVRFRAMVGVEQEGPNMSFRVVQRADHKIWAREMFGRVYMDYYSLNYDADIRFERNLGIWESPWEAGTVNGLRTLARKFALSAPAYNGWNIVANLMAGGVNDAAGLDNVRMALYSAARIPTTLEWKSKRTVANLPVEHFSDFSLLRQQIATMKQQYGDKYNTAPRHLALLSSMEGNFSIATAAATINGGKNAYNAAVACKATALEFSLTFPPWLVEDIETFGLPPALQTVYVNNAAEYLKAIADCAPGKHVVLNAGIYRFQPSDNLFPYDKCNRGNLLYPFVVRADYPNRAHITGGKFETRIAANALYYGLVFRDCPGLWFGIQYYSRNVRVAHCTFTGTDDQLQVQKHTPNVNFDHNFMGNGQKQVVRRMLIDDGGFLIGRSHIVQNFFGARRRSGGNGAELMQNYHSVDLHRNFVHRYIGEAAELLKCSGPCYLYNNTIAADNEGNFPGRSGDDTVIYGNYYISARLRGGGYLNKRITNNYIANNEATFGSNSWPTYLGNTVTFSQNTIVDGSLKVVTWSADPRHQFNTTLVNNLMIRSKYDRSANDETAWKGSGNVVAGPSLPAYLPSALFRTDASITTYTDEFGIKRPVIPVSVGSQRTDPPSNQWDTRVGPAYLPASVRINRNLLADFMFGGFLQDQSNKALQPSDWGNFIWTVTMKDANGVAKDMRCDGPLRSIRSSSYAFCNSATVHGTKGAVATGLSGDHNANGLTLQGWFKTATPISTGAVLLASTTAAYASDSASVGYLVRAGLQPGSLQIVFNTATASYAYTSPAEFGDVQEWVFWAINVHPAGGFVKFYKGNSTSPVKTVGTFSIPVTRISILSGPRNVLSMGALPDGSKSFAGAFTNVRIWASEEGPVRFDTWTDSTGYVNQDELNMLRLFDLKRFIPADITYRTPSLLASKALQSDLKDKVDWGQNGINIGASFIGGALCFQSPVAQARSYVYLPEAQNIDMLSYDTRSYILTFFAKDVTRAQRQVIYDEGSSAVGLNVYIKAGCLYVGIWDQKWGISNHVSFVSTCTVRSGVWHRLLITLGAPPAPQIGNAAFKAYLDGVLFGSKPSARFYPHFDEGGSSFGTISSSTRFEDNSVVLDSSSDAVKLANQFYGCVKNFQIHNTVLPASVASSLDPPEEVASSQPGDDVPSDPNPSDDAVGEPPVVSGASALGVTVGTLVFSALLLAF